MPEHERNHRAYAATALSFGGYSGEGGIDVVLLAEDYKRRRDDVRRKRYGIGPEEFIALPPEVTVPVSNGLPFEAALFIMGQSLAATSGALLRRPLNPNAVYKIKKK